MIEVVQLRRFPLLPRLLNRIATLAYFLDSIKNFHVKMHYDTRILCHVLQDLCNAPRIKSPATITHERNMNMKSRRPLSIMFSVLLPPFRQLQVNANARRIVYRGNKEK